MRAYRLTLIAAATAALLSLSACGGGGGGGGSSGTGGGSTGSGSTNSGTGGTGGAGRGSGGTTDLVAVGGTLQTTVPRATYATGSQGAAALDGLNRVRQAAGAGMLQQSIQLDTAAQAHVQYLITNVNVSGVVVGPAEELGRPAFYEVSPASRVAKAGFAAASVSEVFSMAGTAFFGSDCVGQLLDTVYEAAALLGSSTHVGWGFGTVLFNGANPLCVGELARAAGDAYGQVPAAGQIVAHPYDGQTGVAGLVSLDRDYPPPSTALFPVRIVGRPVIVGLRNADYINFAAAGTLNVTVTRFELLDDAGEPVAAERLAHSDIQAGAGLVLNADDQLPAGMMALVPTAPLAGLHTYRVRLTATLKTGGAAIDRSWTFTTRP